MITNILSAVTGFIIHVVSNLGYLGIVFLMMVQTIAIPIPSEVIIPFAGFLASTGRFNIWLIALLGACGTALGGSAAYYIGYKGGRPLVEKYGKTIMVSEHDIAITDRFFARFGSSAAFLGQLLPIVRSFICFPAGIARVPFKKFIIFTFLGSFVWCLMLSFIGMKLGQNWADLHSRFQKFDYLVVALIIIGIIWWVWRHVKNRGVDKHG